MHVTLYRAQFVPRDCELVAADWVAPQRICAIPWMAFAPAALQGPNFQHFCCMSFFPELCKAARCTTMGRSAALQEEWRRFDDELRGDIAAEAVLGGRPFRRGWHSRSSITACEPSPLSAWRCSAQRGWASVLAARGGTGERRKKRD